MTTFGVILAAGSGTRYGSLKQDELLDGIPLWEMALATAVYSCDRAVLVHPDPLFHAPSDLVTAVEGGGSRSQSVRAALAVIDAFPDDIIVVHDAARPLASKTVWSRVIRAVEDGAVCAVPTIPVTDTIRRRNGIPADREEFWIVQTPQAFRADVLYDLHRSEPECSDDAGLITDGVTTVTGEVSNIKITHPGDLDIAAAHLRSRL